MTYMYVCRYCKGHSDNVMKGERQGKDRGRTGERSVRTDEWNSWRSSSGRTARDRE